MRLAEQFIRGVEKIDRSMVEVLGAEIASEIAETWKRGIRSGAANLAPLAPLTKMAKGSSRPLMDTGGMVNAIDWHRYKGTRSWFIGIRRGNSPPRGRAIDYVRIALIQEYGSIEPIVPKDKGIVHLAIPITKAARRVGYASDYSREVGPLHREGNVLVDEMGVRQYALAKAVVIPPRPIREWTIREVRGRFGDLIRLRIVPRLKQRLGGGNG